MKLVYWQSRERCSALHTEIDSARKEKEVATKFVEKFTRIDFFIS